MSSFRVVTYNVRHEITGERDAWEPRIDHIVDVLESQDADVVALQEATDRQLSDIRARLDGYEWFGAGAHTGQNNPVGYRPGFERIDATVTWLSETPGIPESTGWDAVHPRALTETTLRPTDDALPGAMSVFNTHFDHGGSLARRESAGLLKRRIEALPDDRPVVVAGDFNVPPGSAVDEILTATRGSRSLRDAWGIADSTVGPETTFTGFDRPLAGRRFDRIFVTEGIAVRSACVDTTRYDGDYPSDHLPVRVELVVEEPSDNRAGDGDRAR